VCVYVCVCGVRLGRTECMLCRIGPPVSAAVVVVVGDGGGGGGSSSSNSSAFNMPYCSHILFLRDNC